MNRLAPTSADDCTGPSADTFVDLWLHSRFVLHRRTARSRRARPAWCGISGSICTTALAWSACLATGAVGWVAVRALRDLPRARLPWGVALHVALAFLDILLAAALGIAIGFSRSRGFLELPPLGIMFAHVHLAGVGWATMMDVGLSYRLIPMMLPAAMPAGAMLIVAGLVSFVRHIRDTLKRRLPSSASRAGWCRSTSGTGNSAQAEHVHGTLPMPCRQAAMRVPSCSRGV